MKNIKLYTYMVMTYITCLLVSNICAFKLITVGPLQLTAATIVFPITYVLGDIFSEVYGYKKTKDIIIAGFLGNALMVGIFYLAMVLPYPDTFTHQAEFELVLSNTPRILIASLAGYLAGGLSNSYTLNYIKDKTKMKALWIRLFLSTVVGEFLDSLLFVSIAFIGVLSTSDIIFMILSQAVFKIVFEFILIPVSSMFIGFVKEKEEIKN